MDENQKAIVWADGIAAMAANRAIVRLHALLAAQGAISGQSVEMLRHLHLRDFDVPFDEMPNTGAREMLDATRRVLDELWQSAIQVPLPGTEPGG